LSTLFNRLDDLLWLRCKGMCTLVNNWTPSITISGLHRSRMLDWMLDCHIADNLTGLANFKNRKLSSRSTHGFSIRAPFLINSLGGLQHCLCSSFKDRIAWDQLGTKHYLYNDSRSRARPIPRKEPSKGCYRAPRKRPFRHNSLLSR
jgi:hypothetical protein